MSIHITPHERGWQVKTGGKEKAYRVVDTQEEAIVIAKKVARNQKTNIKIHKRNGTIRGGNNYKD